MKFKPTDNKLYFTRGTASTKVSGEKIPVEYIHYNDPMCGSYINPKGFIALPNFNSISGDKTDYALYIVDGAVVVDTLANVEAAVNAFCKNEIVSATSVTITGCIVDDLAALATRQLTATVNPTGSSQAGTWSTSDPAVATVSVAGLVTGVAAGTATITFTSTDGGFTGTCSVTVV